MAGRLPHLAIVTPICNDFEAFRALCAEIGTAAGGAVHARLGHRHRRWLVEAVDAGCRACRREP